MEAFHTKSNNNFPFGKDDYQRSSIHSDNLFMDDPKLID
jgi:hypothetical protein